MFNYVDRGRVLDIGLLPRVQVVTIISEFVKWLVVGSIACQQLKQCPCIILIKPFSLLKPDFLLIRQDPRDAGEDFKSVLLGFQYGQVRSINSLQSIYNFQVILPDYPYLRSGDHIIQKIYMIHLVMSVSSANTIRIVCLPSLAVNNHPMSWVESFLIKLG